MEQGGIHKIVLYENTGISTVWPDVTNRTEIYEGVVTGGQTVTLEFCNKVSVNQTAGRGANGKLSYTYTILFSLFDLTDATRATLVNLNSRYGYFALLSLNAGRKLWIPAPLLLGNGQFESGNGNAYAFQLQNETETLNDFWSVNEGLPLLEVETDYFLDLGDTEGTVLAYY